MDVHGSRMMDAPREAVFAAILDRATLLAVIPGCEALEETGDGEYRGRIVLRLPGIAGAYRTVVRVVDAEAPSRGRIEGQVDGALGTMKGHAVFRLTETGSGTRVDYDGHGVIDGPLARLDSRFVEGLARSLVDQGLGRLDARLRADTSRGEGAGVDQEPAGTRA